jgi:hypothetical protein
MMRRLLFSPDFMGKWRSVKLFPNGPPAGHMFVHDRYKGVVVVSHEKMRKFMDNDILKAVARLLRQLKVDPNPTSLDVAGPPFCLHSLDFEGGHPNP